MPIFSRPGKTCCILKEHSVQTDSYSLAAHRNKYNNNEIAQMSFKQLRWAYSRGVPVELSNSDYITMILCRARKSAIVGPLAQCV